MDQRNVGLIVLGISIVIVTVILACAFRYAPVEGVPFSIDRWTGKVTSFYSKETPMTTIAEDKEPSSR